MKTSNYTIAERGNWSNHPPNSPENIILREPKPSSNRTLEETHNSEIQFNSRLWKNVT